MSLREHATAAHEGTYTDAARALLVDAIGDPEGTVTALDVEHLAVGPTFTLVVFTDGDLHIGVQTFADGRPPVVSLVKQGADGKWSNQARINTVDDPAANLARLGRLLPTHDPVDENAA